MNSRTKTLGILKPAAIKLRNQGKTFSEIQSELGFIPKGTLSGWLKNIELTSEQKIRIKKIVTENSQIGRQMGAWKNHQKRLERLEKIKLTALEEYDTFVEKPSFLTGLVLYLAEGSKKAEQFQFMNSDPYLIKIMLDWITRFGGVESSSLRFRLYIHELYAHENCEDYWAEKLPASPEQFMKTIYKPTGREYKKNPDYKGCLRIEIRGGNTLYWKTMTWRDCLYRSID